MKMVHHSFAHWCSSGNIHFPMNAFSDQQSAFSKIVEKQPARHQGGLDARNQNQGIRMFRRKALKAKG